MEKLLFGIAARHFVWIPLLLYVVAIIPQVLLSYRTRSAKGVSQSMVFLRFAAMLMYSVYLHLCQLTLAHRVVMPIYVCMVLFLVYQGYHYEQNERKRHWMRISYSVLALFVSAALVLAWWYPWTIGFFIGTCGMSLAWFTDLPQVYKNWKSKSTKGFSFFFPSIIGVGATIEFMLALYLQLPLPTILNTFRAINYYLIYCVPFGLYREQDSVNDA
ncbi:MAG: PQ-loop repeat-containing protein [Candidatus Dependentiae bacterium]|jgi:uncharacterized protein with PQ loop repeat